MTKKPYLILDAGGVLVFPDFDLLAEIANSVGIQTSPPDIEKQHARLLKSLDEFIATNRVFPKIQYFLDIFKQLTDSDEKSQSAFRLTIEADKKKHLWTKTRPWVKKSLDELSEQGYQMAVISNSDGRIEQILQELDLRDYFQIVIDSFVVGVEKPDPKIFEIGINALKWDPTETIYIGDIFYIDIWGANQAGLGAIHLDRTGYYGGWAGIHIPSLMELPELLKKLDGNHLNARLYPTKGFRLR